MNDSASPVFLIKGTTLAGRTFRPSDWAERLAGALTSFGEDHRMKYSPYVRPLTVDGVRCVEVQLLLKEVEPMAFAFLVGFALDNELQVEGL